MPFSFLPSFLPSFLSFFLTFLPLHFLHSLIQPSAAVSVAPPVLIEMKQRIGSWPVSPSHPPTAPPLIQVDYSTGCTVLVPHTAQRDDLHLQLF
jgi:hypothetical protein